MRVVSLDLTTTSFYNSPFSRWSRGKAGVGRQGFATPCRRRICAACNVEEVHPCVLEPLEDGALVLEGLASFDD